MCCCLVCSAARRMDTAQNHGCCFLSSFVLWTCFQCSPAWTIFSSPLLPLSQGLWLSYFKIENEVILFFCTSGAKDWINNSSQLMALCLYWSEPTPFLLYFSHVIICLFSFGTIPLTHLFPIPGHSNRQSFLNVGHTAFCLCVFL